jgi:antitoxin ParD1/3/4
MLHNMKSETPADARIAELRAMLDASIAAGGEASDADIDSALEAKAAQLLKAGF